MLSCAGPHPVAIGMGTLLSNLKGNGSILPLTQFSRDISHLLLFPGRHSSALTPGTASSPTSHNTPLAATFQCRDSSLPPSPLASPIRRELRAHSARSHRRDSSSTSVSSPSASTTPHSSCMEAPMAAPMVALMAQDLLLLAPHDLEDPLRVALPDALVLTDLQHMSLMLRACSLNLTGLQHMGLTLRACSPRALARAVTSLSAYKA